MQRTHRDMYPIWTIFIGPIHHIDRIVRSEGQIHGIPEPRPGKFVAAYRMAVGEGPILDAKKMCAHSFSFVITACIFLPLQERAGVRGFCPEAAYSPQPASYGETAKEVPQCALQESHLLKVPTNDGCRVQAHPVLQDGRVDGAEIHIVLQVPALFLL